VKRIAVEQLHVNRCIPEPREGLMGKEVFLVVHQNPKPKRSIWVTSICEVLVPRIEDVMLPFLHHPPSFSIFNSVT